jgi:hypothetical protein
MKTMKTIKTMKKNYFLKAFGIVTILALSTNHLSAQATGDVVKGANTVKVVDNKGTIKYFQSNNGITQITNTTGDKTTTTWQLGGTLTDDTYIDATGKKFALDGLELTTMAASTDAVTGSVHGGTTSGYTLLVRDEATGAVKKMAATSLIQGGVDEDVLSTDKAAGTYTTAAITGLPTVANRISVYRNGIKLRQLAGGAPDWTLSSGAIAFTAAAGEMYSGDVIEVQWVQ